MKSLLSLAALLAMACGDVDSMDAAVAADASTDASTPDGGAPDTGTPDAVPPRCSPTAAFGAPVHVAELDGPGADYLARLLPDEQTLFLSRDDVFVSTRTTPDGAWGVPQPLGELNTVGAEFGATVTADGLTVYFASDRGGDLDLWTATRAAPSAAFSAPVLVPNVSSSNQDYDPYVTPDGSTLYWWVLEGADWALYQATRGASGFSTPTLVPGLETAGRDSHLAISGDELTVYFASDRAGGLGGLDIYVATRASRTGTFGTPVLIAPVGSASDDLPAWISEDGCVLYMASNRDGGYDIFRAERP